MRVFVAGATGVLGVRVVPLLVAAGHAVAGMTRTPAKSDVLRALGAEAVVCDVYDQARLRAALVAFRPEVVIDELTDLADDPRLIDAAANARIRREGTRNLLAAARAAGVKRVLSQSVAWPLRGDGQAAVEEHERLVLDAGGVVIRYGQLSGPGTYHEHDVPDGPWIDVDDAARRTLEALDAGAASIVTLVGGRPSPL